MNRIKSWISDLSIKKKIICYTYIVIIPVLLIICGLLMYYNYGKMQHERRETGLNNVQGLSDSVELILTDVNDLSLYIAINQEVLDILTADNPEELNQDSRLWVHEAPIQMVEDMMALKGYIKSVAIYPENGVIPYLRCTDASSYVQDTSAVKQTTSYQDALEKKGKSTWRYMPKGSSEVYLATRMDKLVHYRMIYDPTKTTPLGYLVLGIPAEKLEKLCENVIQDTDEGIIVYNYEGEELFRQGSVDEKMVTWLEESSNRNQHTTYDKHDIYTYQAGKRSPIICKIAPGITIWEMMGEIIYMPLILLGGVLVGLLPVLLLVSNIVTRPLGNVCHAMGQFRKGDFEQQLKVETGDEVGEVAACFNKMVTDIKELIDKNYVMALQEKESELATLQAQINPHFLYNTLDVLYWQANDAGNEEIAENIYALSQLFRLVLGQDKGSITVAGEAELVTRYLEIQKMRFSRRMDYEVEIDPRIKEKQIPKLILQPFVENAVVHGIGHSKEHCRIILTGGINQGKLEFIITDTGIGMTEAQIAAIWQRPNENHSSGYKIGGYAIYNVKERLELKYQGDFILQIESGENKGTRVRVVIPME